MRGLGCRQQASNHPLRTIQNNSRPVAVGGDRRCDPVLAVAQVSEGDRGRAAARSLAEERRCHEPE